MLRGRLLGPTDAQRRNEGQRSCLRNQLARRSLCHAPGVSQKHKEHIESTRRDTNDRLRAIGSDSGGRHVGPRSIRLAPIALRYARIRSAELGPP